MRVKHKTSNSYRKASADNPLSNSSLEPESSFFLRRRKTNKSTGVDDSEPVSPCFGATAVPFPRSSGGSNKSNIDIYVTSGKSSLSLGSKFPQNVSDWNEKVQRETHLASDGIKTRHTVDPPRDAKDGYEWVWFPEGYWAERQISRFSVAKQTSRRWFKQVSDRRNDSSSPRRVRTGNKSPVEGKIPMIKIGSVQSHGGSSQNSPVLEERSVKSSDTGTPRSIIKRGLLYASPTHPHFTSPTGQPEGLYCKIKRNIETQGVIKQRTSTDNSHMSSCLDLPSRTTLLLEGTSSYFDREYRSSKTSTNQAHFGQTTLHTPNSADSRPRRVFGLAPWHRRTSHESLLSVSSSVHRLLMGQAPVATPAPEKQDSDQWDDRVEISEPGQPNFLPSEAMRITTPPLSQGSSSSDQPRGFFFEMTSLKDDATSTKSGSPSGLSAGTHPSRRFKKRKSRASLDWWDEDNQARKAAAKGLAKQKQLEANMSLPPEHLPSSPLCPKSPLHKSKGREICVFHGRRRSTSLRSVDRGGVLDYKGLYEK